MSSMNDVFPLFNTFTNLAAGVPRIGLASLPTPVERLTALETDCAGARLFIKRDDLTSELFGGNKTRKLELILGRVVEAGAKQIMTFGFAGSNHAAATALYGKRLGLRCISMLMPQTSSAAVRANLLLGQACGAELMEFSSLSRLKWGAVRHSISSRFKTKERIHMVPAGGSTPEGNTGYVNAALELHAQVKQGAIPEPDRIFVAAGSLGTAAGLAVGSALAGMRSKIIAVRVTHRRFANENLVIKQMARTIRFLGKRDPGFPGFSALSPSIEFEHRFLGDGYALSTKAGVEAARLLYNHHGIALDDVYCAKAFAAFLEAARNKAAKNESLLFWNTSNSSDISKLANGVDYRQLPAVFHRYFESDQSL